MNRDIELIVFDWDGTLMDSAGLIVECMQKAIGELGLPPRSDEQVADIIGLGLREAVRALYPEAHEDLLPALVGRYREHWLARQHRCRLFPGVRETLELLHGEGYRLAVATGKSRAGLERALQATGLERLFSSTRCADETASKPDPRMAREILEETGCPPGAAVLVGDTEYDLEMANRAGMHAVGVAYGVHGWERLMKHAPRAILEQLSELPDWLAEWRSACERATATAPGA